MKRFLFAAWLGLSPLVAVAGTAEPGSTSGVSLGRPANARAASAPSTTAHLAPQANSTTVQTTSWSPLGGQDGWIVRGQSPTNGPVLGRPNRSAAANTLGTTPEEAFNCGVAEGPPPTNTGPLLSGSTPSWVMPTTNGTGGYFDWFVPNNVFQSDHCFDRFISPMTNPFFFEDPRSLTELRPIFMYQKTPGANPITTGGNIFYYALQGRLALNDRLSIVMPKLGLITLPDLAAPVAQSSETGFAEVMIGPKLTFWRDDASNIIAAAGAHFELPIGDGKVFQDTGDGSVTPYLTLAFEFYDNWHFMAAAGYRISFDEERSESVFVSLHVDYGFFNRIFPFAELHWWHYTKNGTIFPATFEGQDIINIGSTAVQGNDVLNLALGLRFKIIGETLQAGFAVEFPLLDRQDLLEYRLSADLIIRY